MERGIFACAFLFALSLWAAPLHAQGDTPDHNEAPAQTPAASESKTRTEKEAKADKSNKNEFSLIEQKAIVKLASAHKIAMNEASWLLACPKIDPKNAPNLYPVSTQIYYFGRIMQSYKNALYSTLETLDDNSRKKALKYLESKYYGKKNPNLNLFKQPVSPNGTLFKTNESLGKSLKAIALDAKHRYMSDEKINLDSVRSKKPGAQIKEPRNEQLPNDLDLIGDYEAFYDNYRPFYDAYLSGGGNSSQLSELGKKKCADLNKGATKYKRWEEDKIEERVVVKNEKIDEYFDKKTDDKKATSQEDKPSPDSPDSKAEEESPSNIIERAASAVVDKTEQQLLKPSTNETLPSKKGFANNPDTDSEAPVAPDVITRGAGDAVQKAKTQKAWDEFKAGKHTDTSILEGDFPWRNSVNKTKEKAVLLSYLSGKPRTKTIGNFGARATTLRKFAQHDFNLQKTKEQFVAEFSSRIPLFVTEEDLEAIADCGCTGREGKLDSGAEVFAGLMHDYLSRIKPEDVQ